MSATQSWSMPVSSMRAARFRYTRRWWPESVVRTKRRRRRQSRLSSAISRATRLWFTAQPWLAQLARYPAIAVVTPVGEHDLLHLAREAPPLPHAAHAPASDDKNPPG